MLISEFDFDLPDELIAQQPIANRAYSRMLFVDSADAKFRDERFYDFPRFLRKGDVVVLNNTRVFPARLSGASETGAKIELFLVREIENKIWETLARPAKRLRANKRISFGENLTARVLEKTAEGRVVVKFETGDDFDEILDRIGRTPLPPYIKRSGETLADGDDKNRYQTVFAKNRGAIAAPTAGLHFTPEVLAEIETRGATLAEITLHVGYGTFEPVRVADLSEHRVLPEHGEISRKTAEILNEARAENRRIIAVGTTTTRALESSVNEKGEVAAGNFSAALTITPGYEFKIIKGLLTNFHLPQSSLLVLVSTFAGYDLTMRAYQHAVAARYRFYSYGDCMLII